MKTEWKIRVQGYGTFDFSGTEAAAEAMRAHKARWEGGSAMMWRADLARESDRIRAEIAERLDTDGKFDERLLTKLRKACRAEALAA